MLNIERENAILELLKQKETVKIKEIMKELNISEATARRDLSALEKRELVKRVHGGAILIEKNSFLKDLNVQYRKDICRDEKEKIAKFAASLVKDGSCIYLDAGTTSEKMIKYLKGKNIKIVTNGLNFIDEIEKLKIETYLVGGKIKSKTSCTVGFPAVNFLKNFNFDYVFMGANAFNKDGYSTPDVEEAMVKGTAVSRGENIFFLCDHTKLEKNSFVTFSKLCDGILITDKELPAEYDEIVTVEVVK